MLLVKTYLDKSNIHGIGLFADQDIPLGSLVYKPSSQFDIEIQARELKKLDELSKMAIQHYGYKHSQKDIFSLAFDDIRFCNHVRANLTRNNEGFLVAQKKIQRGEELTQDYSEFEDLRKELA